jgi:hypothetical protein
MGKQLRWPADKVERWPIEKLIPYARNPRTHSADQIDRIARAIGQFGWTAPVLCDEKGVLIAGHGRVMAAKKMGLAEVPVITARGWTDEQKRAYVIWDNQSTLLSGWDEELLRAELADLDLGKFDLSLTGFAGDELAAFLKAPNDRDLDSSARLGGLKYCVILECRDELHQIEMLGKLEQDGYTCRPLIS